MTYRCEAATITGFVQQLACCYIRHGYHLYVVGHVPEAKAPGAVDRRMVERYKVGISKYSRARRKRAGLANVQYIRFRRFFVLCATEPRGTHEFFTEHSPKQIRHIARQPISVAGYSVGYHRGVDRQWHVSVRIHPERYRDIKAHLLDIARRRNTSQLEVELSSLPFEPYAPVRRQYLALWRAVNRERKTAGLPQLSLSCLRMKRQVVRPFGTAAELASSQEAQTA